MEIAGKEEETTEAPVTAEQALKDEEALATNAQAAKDRVSEPQVLDNAGTTEAKQKTAEFACAALRICGIIAFRYDDMLLADQMAARGAPSRSVAQSLGTYAIGMASDVRQTASSIVAKAQEGFEEVRLAATDASASSTAMVTLTGCITELNKKANDQVIKVLNHNVTYMELQAKGLMLTVAFMTPRNSRGLKQGSMAKCKRSTCNCS